MPWEIILPLAAWGIERILTIRGRKKDVPKQMTNILDNLAQGATDKIPPSLKEAMDRYVAVETRKQIDQHLLQLGAAALRKAAKPKEGDEDENPFAGNAFLPMAPGAPAESRGKK